MSSAIVERILEEVKKLTADERRDLREALAHETPLPAPAFNTHEREHAWVERNRDEYLNQWVALDGDRLLAHGLDPRTVYLSAREVGVRAPYLTRVEPRDELPFAGW
jgi:hypothetical protein